ncbi:MAG: 50S ribosomal protein L22 [Isosphaeraceae bacterium]|jgi:large subunit ribosomal protein L22|nr:50S ribosomal protein L22 [Isosphaeraceae bacterium]
MAPTIVQYRASHRFARISVRKLLPILDLIRGKYADDAVDILRYMPHRGARMIEKVLKSAMANAEDRGLRNSGDLVISDARGEGGPFFKRLMPRARGMAYMIRRRSSHIIIGLTDYESLAKFYEDAGTGADAAEDDGNQD